MSRFENGVVFVHRRMTSPESDIGANGYRLAILVTLISWANWKDGERTVQCNGKPLKLKRGQVLIGIRELADHLKFSKDTVFRQLKYLCERDTIRKEGATEGTLITLLKYEQYQTLTKNVRQGCDTDATAAGRDSGRQPNACQDSSDTEIQEYSNSGVLPSLNSKARELLGHVKPELIQTWKETFKDDVWISERINAAASWVIANPKRGNKKNWGQFLNNWLNRKQFDSTIRETPAISSQATQIVAFMQQRSDDDADTAVCS